MMSEESKQMVVQVTEAIVTVPSVTVATRSYYSTHLLAAAQDAAARSKNIEDRLTATDAKRFSLQHRGEVLSAVTHSFAFLEATINEVLLDAAEGQMAKFEGIERSMVEAWAALGGAIGDVTATLERYQLALVIAGRERFDKGAEPWQGADLLRKLRNELVHFRPETVSAEVPRRIAKQLSSKVQANPLPSNDWDLDGWLSAACAKWAVDSAIALTDEFCARTGIRPNYQLVLEKLRADNP